MKKKILLADKAEELKTLRQVSKPIQDFDKNTQRLVADMFETMKSYKGVGLSAIQIGVDSRALIAEYPKDGVPKTVLINPEITWVSRKQVLDEEGCLSIPNIYGMVKRPEKIKYKGLDENGKIIEGKADGLHARVIQHEIDHLNGVLFIDLLEGDAYKYETQDDTEKI